MDRLGRQQNDGEYQIHEAGIEERVRSRSREKRITTTRTVKTITTVEHKTREIEKIDREDEESPEIEKID